MTSPDLTAIPVAPATAQTSNRFYRGMALAFLITIIVGFSNSARQRATAGAPPLEAYVVAHGVLFASWFVIFLVQTTLAATDRIALHRRLGWIAGAQAAVMAVSGPLIAIAAARNGRLPGDGLVFMLVMMVDVLGFAILVAAAIYFRRRAETHKRLMLLGTLSMLPPAISRWPLVNGNGALVALVLFAFIVAAPVRDLVARRRMHPVSVWGGVALLVSAPLRFAIAHTDTWHAIARWLIR